MTFDEFVTKFTTEEDCLAYLFHLRCGDGFSCPKCGANEYWIVNKILYTCKRCRHQTSVLAGTIFQDTRKPVRSWFIAIWWITTQKYGASASGLQQILGLNSHQTAWTWLHKIRTVMVNPSRTKLSGVIEIDDSYVGGEEIGGKRGRGTDNKAILAFAVEVRGKKLGRVRINVIPDVTSKTLHNFISDNIEQGSEITTDGFSSYNGIEAKGYHHRVYKQTNATTEDEKLPHAHLVISLLKRWLLGTHQGAVSEKYLQAYLDEHVFRFNRRTFAKRGLLFYRLLENAMTVAPTSYKELTSRVNIIGTISLPC